MSQYEYFATVYDRMMDNIPYEEWKQYILQLLFKYGVNPYASIAELGCGTGVMTRLLAGDGFAMTAIDLSEDMLDIAGSYNIKNDIAKMNKAAAYNDKEVNVSRCKGTEASEEEDAFSNIIYLHQDMRELSLLGKQDVIISICDSMNYLLTDEDLYKTMHAVKNNLKQGGIFIFDLKTEYFYENELDDETFSEDMGEFSYLWRNQYSTVDHIHRYYLEFYVDGRVIREMHKQRAFSAMDIKNAALKAGFTSAAAYDAFTFNKPRKKSERIYIVMRNV